MQPSLPQQTPSQGAYARTQPEGLLAEVQAYAENKFAAASQAFDPGSFLPAAEPGHLWEAFTAREAGRSVWAFLRENWVAWQFPIEKGISQSATYRAATLKGQPGPGPSSLAPFPEGAPLDFFLYESLAGPVPVLQFEERADFVAAVQALVFKNEPEPLPASMGACLLKGINNWPRIARLKAGWQQSSPSSSWAAYFRAEVLPHKAKFQDQVILLSKKPYSGIPAQKLGLDKQEWLETPAIIRLEHECTHFFTAHYLGGMYVNMHDELIADYMGITQALGFFNPSWFLHFLGIETQVYRKGGRLENYTGKAGLSAAAFRQLQALLRNAAGQLCEFDQWVRRQPGPSHRLTSLLTLASLSLLQIGSTDGAKLMMENYTNFNSKTAER